MGILRRDCPHCLTASVAFSISHSYLLPGQQSVYGNVGVCAACHKPLGFLARNPRNGFSPHQAQGNIEPDMIVVGQWPSVVAPIAPPHTPVAIARRFVEGEEAFARGSWNAAVAMYRSALDIATKALPDVPVRQSFFQRLQWLHDNHRITPDMKDWADHVRVEGNDALHDPDEFTEDDARPLRLFTETFLRYTFELPGEVAAFRGRTAEVMDTAAQ